MAPAAEQPAFVGQRKRDGALARQRRPQLETDHALGQSSGADHTVGGLGIVDPGPANPPPPNLAALADADPPDRRDSVDLPGPDQESEGEGTGVEPGLVGPSRGEQRQSRHRRIDPQPARHAVDRRRHDAVRSDHQLLLGPTRPKQQNCQGKDYRAPSDHRQISHQCAPRKAGVRLRRDWGGKA